MFFKCSSTLPAFAAMTAAVLFTAASATAQQARLWNVDVLDSAQRVSEPGALGPITIVGAQNGTFSGAVAVESTEALTGLRAEVGPLSLDGEALPSDAVTVRYATQWAGNYRRYRPEGLDVLLESAPAKIEPDNGRALAAVWVTVDVPADAKPGVYRGELTVRAQGLRPQAVPVELTVADWAIPQTQEWRTWVELIQSPDTLALEYEVPLWSDKHWALIAESMKLIHETGSRVVYIPLLAQTNQGNEQSMVRWIPQPDGSYEQDYSIMEKYLDLAEEHMGKPKMVVFYVWDAYLVGGEERPQVDESAPKYSQEQQRLAGERWDLRHKGLSVTMLDKSTGKAELGYLPQYTDSKSRALWQPVWRELHQRMAKRGLEDLMMLGMITDVGPSEKEVAFLKQTSGDLPWVAHRHPSGLRGKPPVDNNLLQGIADIGYEAHVYDIMYQVNPEKGRQYGWKTPELRVFFGRNGIPQGSALRMRMMPELNITGEQRGMGRIGADFWYVLEDKRGRRAGAVYARYPENMWRNLNIDSWLLAPGEDGPVATARLENMIEGLQECEARIYLESVLLDPRKKRRIGDDLAESIQTLLDERQFALWRGRWSNVEQLKKLDAIGNARNPHEAIWRGLSKAGVEMPGFWDSEARQMRSDEARKGEDWFADSNWQERTQQLYDFAAQVQKKLGDQ